MDLNPYVERLRDDLAAAAAAGDDDTRRTAALLGAALEPATRLALMNALSDLAAEVTAALDGPVVELRIDGRDIRVAVSATASPNASASAMPPPQSEPVNAALPPPTPPPIDGGDISRITLRLIDQIKGQAERAAADQGVSLNTWVSHAVQGALQGGRPPGWARPQPDAPRDPGTDTTGPVHGWVRG